jgi:hypothetical protein
MRRRTIGDVVIKANQLGELGGVGGGGGDCTDAFL